MKKEEKKETKGRDNQHSPCFCEGVAGRRPAMLHMKVCWSRKAEVQGFRGFGGFGCFGGFGGLGVLGV